MNWIHQLELYQFRNLEKVKINLQKGIHFIYGDNGSGKTSLLESIYTLAHGRSFRCRYPQQLMMDNKDTFRVIIKLSNADSSTTLLGWERQKNQENTLKINGEVTKQFSKVARYLPTLLIDTDTHRDFASGPKVRRQFIDWAVFHSQPEYLGYWKEYQQQLSQRNAALKAGYGYEVWSHELDKSSKKIDEIRKNVINEWSDCFYKMVDFLNISGFDLSFKYDRGWQSDFSLSEVLNQHIDKDLRMGFTQHGPHRADLKITCQNSPAFQKLSQGQQKILSYAMKLSQAYYLKEKHKKHSIILIDDLPAELDFAKRSAVISCLEEMESQSIVTGVLEKDVLDLSKGKPCFKISKGVVTSFSNTEA